MSAIPDDVIEVTAREVYARYHLRSNRPVWDAAPDKTKQAFRADALAILQATQKSGLWREIKTAPMDGSWILAFGEAFPELVDRGRCAAFDLAKPRVPHTMLIKWIEGWYDEEIDLGNGTFRKERKQGYAYWWPEPHAFVPTHWMPLPEPPKATES
jgi:hypothetical protein